MRRVMAVKINFGNIPGFLLLLLGAFWLSIIVTQYTSLSQPISIPISIWVVTRLNEWLELHMTLATLFLVGFVAVQASPEGKDGVALVEAILGSVGLSFEPYGW